MIKYLLQSSDNTSHPLNIDVALPAPESERQKLNVCQKSMTYQPPSTVPSVNVFADLASVQVDGGLINPWSWVSHQPMGTDGLKCLSNILYLIGM